MSGKSLLDSLRGGAAPPRPEPHGTPASDDSYEEPSGDGRSARHQVFAVQLVQANRDAQAVTYASMHSPLVFNPSKGITFRYENTDGLHEVRVEGNNLDAAFDKLCSGKREVLRVNGSTIVAITVRQVQQASP